MGDLFTSLSLAASGMRSQAMRLRHVSENIANRLLKKSALDPVLGT